MIIQRDLIDDVLINMIKQSNIPLNRIERGSLMPKNTLNKAIKKKHIPIKYRNRIKEFFKLVNNDIVKNLELL